MKKIRTARAKHKAHTKQKPKPRLVSKAHRLEQSESQPAFAAVQRFIERTESKDKKRN
jgi:hypothetical protein